MTSPPSPRTSLIQVHTSSAIVTITAGQASREAISSALALNLFLADRAAPLAPDPARRLDDRVVEALLEPVAGHVERSLDACEERLLAAHTPEAAGDAYRGLATDLGRALLEVPDVVRLFLQESRAPATGAREPIRRLADRFAAEPRVSEETFALFLNQFRYDPTPLNAEVVETREEDFYIRERIGFDAAYGDERVTAYLFLPAEGTPPAFEEVSWAGRIAPLPQPKGWLQLYLSALELAEFSALAAEQGLQRHP